MHPRNNTERVPFQSLSQDSKAKGRPPISFFLKNANKGIENRQASHFSEVSLWSLLQIITIVGKPIFLFLFKWHYFLIQWSLRILKHIGQSVCSVTWMWWFSIVCVQQGHQLHSCVVNWLLYIAHHLSGTNLKSSCFLVTVFEEVCRWSGDCKIWVMTLHIIYTS